MPTWMNTRALNLYGLLACAGLMAFAFYLQYIEGLEPCPLCMAQRIALIAVGVVLLIAVVHNAENVGRRIYAFLTMLFASGGIALSVRQIWLQNLPEDQVPACGPGLDYMLEVFPFQEVLQMMLMGSGECAEVQWVFLGLSIPGWTLICFIGFALLGLLQLVRR